MGSGFGKGVKTVVKWEFDLPISLPDLPISPKEIGISSRDLCISLAPPASFKRAL